MNKLGSYATAWPNFAGRKSASPENTKIGVERGKLPRYVRQLANRGT